MDKKRELVIVEDNPMYRELLVHHFREEREYEVLAFADAESCLAAVQRPPAALLLDQDLDPMENGGLSGHELLQKLQAKGLGAPALFLTGHRSVQPAAEILKAGAFAYMRKEISDLDLVSERLREMCTWQDLRESSQELRRKQKQKFIRALTWTGLLIAGFLTFRRV